MTSYTATRVGGYTGVVMSAWTVGVGYASLIATNYVVGRGLFGIRTNGELSKLYPTDITPAGFAFGIWGPIFLLQGLRTFDVLVGREQHAPGTVERCWVVTWILQNAWQIVFLTLPMNPSIASTNRKLASLVPASGLLLGAHFFMVRSALATRETNAASDITTDITRNFASGLNAGWLAAASGVGLALIAGEIIARTVGNKERRKYRDGIGSLLVLTVATYGTLSSAYLGAHTRSAITGAGYAMAISWACYGITRREQSLSGVRGVSALGMYASAVTCVACIVRRVL